MVIYNFTPLYISMAWAEPNDSFGKLSPKEQQEFKDSLLSSERTVAVSSGGLVDNLQKYTERSLINPYTHPGAALLRKDYGQDPQYKEFFSKLTIEDNGNIVYDHKRFSLNSNWGYELLAEHNGKDIFIWDYEDKNKNTWIGWVTYIDGKIAGKIAKQQGKKLFKNTDQADAFVNSFPWKTTKDKIFALKILFNLRLSGYWHSNSKKWNNLDIGWITLSELENGRVREVKWGGFGAILKSDDALYPQPVLAFEKC